MKKGIKIIAATLVAFLLLAGLLFIENRGVIYNGNYTSTFAEMDNKEYSDNVEPFIECLVVADSNVEISNIYNTVIKFILDSMSVKYDEVDLATEDLPDLSKYQTIVLVITDLSYLKEDITRLNEWVYDGGGLMNAYTYAASSYFNLFSPKLGVIEGGYSYETVEELDIEDGFMIGADKNYKIDAIDTSLSVLLNSDCHVYISEANNHIPILWEKSYGKGKYVVINIEEYTKANRGILSAAYSLLQKAFAYPVINASVFYLDDFPCQIPNGYNEYITRDYNMSIHDFYINVWWPRVLEWQKEYGIVHTGMIIETYNDTVEAPFERQTVTDSFSLLGTMLLNHGGEIGLHGYDHMPLCMTGFDYNGEFDGYELWPNQESMKEGIQELMSFSDKLFPEAIFSTYVPPSNVLSEEGREMLVKYFPNIKVIASSYLPLDNGSEYIQEFDVGDDGIINTPRITAGCELDDYMYYVAFSELNFHYVQSHFLHTDDSLDPERGAELGWEKLAVSFEQYLSWIYSIVPNLRNTTGLQMGEAVEDYDNLAVQKTYVERGLNLTLGGFSGEAYLMLRLNEGTLDTIQGGTAENITGNLYVIHAENDVISITWK